MNRIPLELRNGKTVGYIEGDCAVFPVAGRNYFAKSHGYPIDEFALDAVRRCECRWLVFLRRNDERRLRISLEDFDRLRQPLDFGYGVKWVVADWHYEDLDAPGDSGAQAVAAL